MADFKRYFPIFEWGRTYDRGALGHDLTAAVIVTFMLIPQSLAYALLAGLPPEAGIYASIVPILLYAVRHQPGAGGRAGGGGVFADRVHRRSGGRIRGRPVTPQRR
jgi:hypothetical protein